MSTAKSFQVRPAGLADLPKLAALFDAYRVFYGQPADLALAHAFLQARLENQQSVVFIGVNEGGEALGFTQLYPSFSSVSAARIFILNDLYVAPAARRSGVAQALLATAADYGRSQGAVRLALTTAVDNHAAQALYAAQGWVRDTQFLAYNLSLSPRR